MEYKILLDKIIKNKISIGELEKIKINYNKYENLDLIDFIKEYQNYNNKADNILELLDGLDRIGYKFNDELFSNHLINGLNDEVTIWYINKFPPNDKFQDNNKFLIDASLSIEAYRGYGFPLKILLSNGFNPNFNGIDWFYFKGHYDGGQEVCFEAYDLFFKYGYKFSNPLMFYVLISKISYEIEPNPPLRLANSLIQIDIQKFMEYDEIKKWLQMNIIVINESDLQNFLDLKYYNSRDQIINELINEICFIKNKFIKWPNILLNFDNYKPDQMDRSNINMCKYPLIGFVDKFIQEEFII